MANKRNYASQAKFLASYATFGLLTRAAKDAVIDQSTHSIWLRDDPEYPEKFKKAQEEFAERVRAEITRRGMYGWEEVTVTVEDDGVRKVTKTRKRRLYSERMLAMLAKRVDPAFREYADPVVVIRGADLTPAEAAAAMDRSIGPPDAEAAP